MKKNIRNNNTDIKKRKKEKNEKKFVLKTSVWVRVYS
jgi:hypothetical protein